MLRLKMWRILNWDCLISPFRASAVELDGFREFSQLLSMCVCVFVVDEFFCARVYVDQRTCFCSLLLGLVCPLLWYYATFLYFRKYYQRDPRERDGLAANAVAVSVTLTMFCSIDYLFQAMCDNLDNLLWMLFSLFRILK